MALPIYTSAAFTGTTGVELAPNAQVEVRSEADDSLVTLYEDRDGTSQINNPFQADAFGRFQFFANPSIDGWRITVTSGSDSHTLRYQQPMIGPTIISSNYGARGDGVSDDTVPIQAAINAAIANDEGGIVIFPAGVYRVTSTLDAIDAPAPLVLRGAGVRNTVIFGDFTGPGDAIIDISFTDNANRIPGHIIEDLTICSNGVVGDPIAIKAMKSFQQSIRRVFVPGDGTPVAGEVRRHANIGLLMTEVNNSEVNECTFQGGYQPVAFDIGTTVRFSGSSSDATLTASEAVFTSDMVGSYIVLEDGGGSSDSTDHYYDTIASINSATSVELTNTLPESISNVRGSIGYVIGSMTASDPTLTLNVDVLTQDHVGMRVFVPLGHTKSDAGNTNGLLCTSIVSVTSASTCELAHAPDVNVTSQPIIFCPAVFIGTLREEEGSGRQTNDCVLQQVQIESFQGAGIVVNKAIALYLDNCKLHSESWSNAPNRVTRSMFCAVLSEVKNVEIRSTPLTFHWYAGLGQIWMMGSRGQLILDGFETLGLLKDTSVVHLSGQNTTACRVQFGPGWITDGVSKHSAGWKPYNRPSFLARATVHGGQVNERSGADQFALTPQLVAGAFSSVNGRFIELLDDTAVKFLPPATFGLLALSSGAAGVNGIIAFRTSEDTVGVLTETLAAGANVEVTTGDLTGTTGNDTKFTVSVGTSDGMIHLENRRGFTVRVGLSILAPGTVSA